MAARAAAHAGPIDLPDPVPDSALCDGHVALLEADLAGTDVIWWHGSDLSHEAVPTRWTPRLGEGVAQPTDPATGNTGTGRSGSATGLRTRAGVHCGFVAPDVTATAGHAILAIRWITPPGQEARTLLTLNMGGGARREDGANYLFLSHADGRITLKDDEGRADISLPCPDIDAPRLALISLTDTMLSLDLDGTQASTNATAPILEGGASLFLGARNHRPKLLKTLGDALIFDVWFWPSPDRINTERALRRYHLWAIP